MGEDTSDSGESWFDAAEHLASAAVEGVTHAAEAAIDTTVDAFEAAGATAEEAASFISSDAEAIPVIGAVVSAGEVVYHAGAAVYDGATGDWEGAADQSLSMSESALNVATGGVAGLVEGAWDVGNAAGGGGEETTAHGLLHEGTQALGGAIGDAVYDATQ